MLVRQADGPRQIEIMRSLLAQQRFVPMVAQQGTSEFRGLWQPWLSDEKTADRVAVLVRGMPAQTLEAGLNQRTVVIEFDNVASAMAAYQSPAYQEARALLGDTVERDIRIVEGTE